MHNMELPRSARSAHLLLEFGAEHGVSSAQCLRNTGLTAAQLTSPTAEIRGAQELALIRNLATALPPGAGLEAGSRYTLEMFGMLGLACLTAPTARDFVELSLRYQDLSFTLAEAELAAGDDASRVLIEVSYLPADARRFVADHCMAYVWATMRDVCDHVAGVGFPYQQPTDPGRYEELFGVRPHFDQPSAWIAFRNTDLDRKRRLVDSAASRLCEQQCAALLAEREATVGMAGVVRARLNRATGRMPTMETVASDLHLSSRSLHRRLAAERTTFRQLDEEVRRRRADELLTDGLPVGQVAQNIGYATSSAFVHAYKRWHGVSPGRHRDRGRKIAPSVRLASDPAVS